jgi:hypothetical protein
MPMFSDMLKGHPALTAGLLTAMGGKNVGQAARWARDEPHRERQLGLDINIQGLDEEIDRQFTDLSVYRAGGGYSKPGPSLAGRGQHSPASLGPGRGSDLIDRYKQTPQLQSRMGPLGGMYRRGGY